MSTRVSRRTILAGTAASAAAALLAACGGGNSTTAPKPAATTAPTTAAAATTAPAASAAAATRPAGSAPAAASTTTTASGSAVAGTTTAASTGTGPLKPKTGADAFKGKKLSYFQKGQFYKAVQDGIGSNIKTYTESVGAGVDLSLQSTTDPGANVQKVQAGVQSGQPFDLADDIGGGPQQLITLGALTDVSDITKQLIDAYGAIMPILPPGLQQNGKYLAVPFFTSSDAWFVRKDWCQAKGIDPASLDTYEKARDAALAISDPSKNQFGWGFSPYAPGDGIQLITHVVHSWGGAIQDKTGTKVVWNSPETVAGITWLADIYLNTKYKSMLPTGYESWDGSGNNMAWLNGTIGMTANAFTLYAKSKDDKNPVFDKTYVLQRPKGPAVKESLRGGQLGYFYIPKGAKNADLAVETIKSIMQPDQWFGLAKNGGGLILPAFESQWKNDFWKSDPNYAQLEAQVRDPTGYNQTFYPGPITAGVSGVIANQVLENMMASIIQKGQKVDAAVKDAHDQIVKIFEQFGLKQ